MDEDSHGKPQLPDVHALHRHNVDELRAVIAQLLQQVEFLQSKKTRADLQDAQLARLREANQNLVLAAFGAQDLQATAEAAIVRQTEFLSMLAHEVRNPLQPIAMANELLGKVAVGGPEVARYQRIIGRQVTHLARLVDDLLDASRVSSGKISMQIAPLTLAAVIDAAVETSRPWLEKRRQQLDIVLPPQPVPLAGDLVRLAQALSNLLINACKFSPENERIAIQADLLARHVRIVVSDHGIGVEAQLQPLIFDLFTQGLRSTERAQGGLGIGLSLARSIVTMHGGSIAVASEGIGLGSAFTVLLPRVAQAPAALPAAPPPAAAHTGSPQRILLVEDNFDASDTLCQLLIQAGHAVTQRFDGVTALASASVHHYDVVICDIGLPGMDGYLLVEKIRAAVRGVMPVFVATSGYNQDHERTRATAAGFDHYLVKPLAIADLLTLIAQRGPSAAH